MLREGLNGHWGQASLRRYPAGGLKHLLFRLLLDVVISIHYHLKNTSKLILRLCNILFREDHVSEALGQSQFRHTIPSLASVTLPPQKRLHLDLFIRRPYIRIACRYPHLIQGSQSAKARQPSPLTKSCYWWVRTCTRFEGRPLIWKPTRVGPSP